jgi:hypothetical protein
MKKPSIWLSILLNDHPNLFNLSQLRQIKRQTIISENLFFEFKLTFQYRPQATDSP